MSKRATIVVDLQNDYLGTGKWALSGIDAALANAVRVIEASRSRGEPVIHVRHEFIGDDAPFFAAGSEGAEIIPTVAPLPGEAVVTKNHPNSFRDTALQHELDEAGITHLVLVGAMSHMCIEATARALFIHPNTVRYRVKRIQDITGYNPADAREAYILRMAITLGRLQGT